MSKKGQTKIEKRLAASKVKHIKRKESVFTVKTVGGAHKKEASIPVSIIVRDLLKVARNMKEAKHILSQGKIIVNGKIRRDYRYAVGLFDVISIPEINKSYRLGFDKQGRFILNEEKDAKTRVCKIVAKKTVKGNKIMVITDDGRQLEDNENKINIGDSVKISFDNQKILTHLPLQKGSKVYIIGGKHAGEKAKVNEVRKGSITKPMLVLLKGEEKQFETEMKNIIVFE